MSWKQYYLSHGHGGGGGGGGGGINLDLRKLPVKGDSKMAQQVKVFAAEPDVLSFGQKEKTRG